MYKASMGRQTQMKINKGQEGETIEVKLERIINNKEPIKDGAPIIFEERNTGVNPSHDIRSDRFEIAVIGMDKIDKSIKAKREEKGKKFEMEIVKDEPTDTTKEN